MTLALLELQFSRDLTRWFKSKCKSLINLDKDLNLNAYFVCIIHRKSINFLSTGSSFSPKETFIFVCNLSYPFIQSQCLIKIYLTKYQVLYRDLLSIIWSLSRMQTNFVFYYFWYRITSNWPIVVLFQSICYKSTNKTWF